MEMIEIDIDEDDLKCPSCGSVWSDYFTEKDKDPNICDHLCFLWDDFDSVGPFIMNDNKWQGEKFTREYLKLYNKPEYETDDIESLSPNCDILEELDSKDMNIDSIFVFSNAYGSDHTIYFGYNSLGGTIDLVKVSKKTYITKS